MANIQERKQISEDMLEKNRWYVGRGRNQNVAFFDGEYFMTWWDPSNKVREKIETYYGPESGCFQPFLELPTLEEVLNLWRVEKPELIPDNKLKDGKVYLGKGREEHDYIGFWQAKRNQFVTIGKDESRRTGFAAKLLRYGTGFLPLIPIDEGKMIKPENSHYGQILEVNSIRKVVLAEDLY